MKKKTSKVVQSPNAPNGLFETQVSGPLLDEAREEVEKLVATILAGQIASNQHLYVNLPHPLAAPCQREVGVPVLEWGDSRVSAIESLFVVALRQLGVVKQVHTTV